MAEYLEIGSSPSEEPCVQMGHSIPWDGIAARREMSAFIHLLRRRFGNEPDGARLRIKTFNAGEYSEVVCEYDRDLPESYAYALNCANEAPPEWDLFALVELERSGYDVNAIRPTYRDRWATPVSRLEGLA